MANGGGQITYFAETDARGRRTRFGIKEPDRSRHMYVIGKTGMGKSTLLENLAIQDIWNGNGLAYIDPHGASADKLLEYVPQERIKDVLYFAPFDMEYPVGFNIMEDVAPDKRHFVVSGLMSTFEKIWADAWSARMSYILQNTIHALLEYPGATLLDVNRMYTNKTFRDKVVTNITDVSVKAFWTEEFTKYTDRYTQEATPAIQNKVGQLAANPLIRNIVGQPNSSFDIRKMMDERKILIINLSKGRVGEGNAMLLGSMMVNKIYLSAMSRADATDQQLRQLPNFYLYVDEFQNFANKSFADILSESRKYKLNLTIAHQYIEQMEEEVRAAVFGNVGTLVSFRVGAFDAEVLEKEFAPTFTAQDLVNLGFAQIYLRLMIDGVGSAPFSATTLTPIEPPAKSFKQEVITHSRSIYTKLRQEIEAMIGERFAIGTPADTANVSQGAEKHPSRDRGRERVGVPTERNQNRERQQTTERQIPQPLQRPGRERQDSPSSTMHQTGNPRDSKKRGKGEEREGRTALREALANILASQPASTAEKQHTPSDTGNSPSPASPPRVQPAPEKSEKKEQPERNERNQTSQGAKQEIPEDVLKKLLDVEEER